MDTRDIGFWSPGQALAVAYEAFSQRFGVDWLWQAFAALTLDAKGTLREHQQLEDDVDKYLQYPLNLEGDALVNWLCTAKADPAQHRLLLHCAVRWWRARDALVALPETTHVAKQYAEGLTEPHARQLLGQMLYRGAAPDTNRPSNRPEH